MNISKKLDHYFDLQKEIYEYFGYHEQWRIFPMELNTGAPWMQIGGDAKGDGAHIVWADEPFAPGMIKEGRHYSGYVYTQRHLNRWIFRGEQFTMALIDTQTDGNIILMIFNNELECTDPRLKDLYGEYW